MGDLVVDVLLDPRIGRQLGRGGTLDLPGRLPLREGHALPGFEGHPRPVGQLQLDDPLEHRERARVGRKGAIDRERRTPHRGRRHRSVLLPGLRLRQLLDPIERPPSTQLGVDDLRRFRILEIREGELGRMVNTGQRTVEETDLREPARIGPHRVAHRERLAAGPRLRRSAPGLDRDVGRDHPKLRKRLGPRRLGRRRLGAATTTRHPKHRDRRQEDHRQVTFHQGEPPLPPGLALSLAALVRVRTLHRLPSPCSDDAPLPAKM